MNRSLCRWSHTTRFAPTAHSIIPNENFHKCRHRGKLYFSDPFQRWSCENAHESIKCFTVSQIRSPFYVGALNKIKRTFFHLMAVTGRLEAYTMQFSLEASFSFINYIIWWCLVSLWLLSILNHAKSILKCIIVIKSEGYLWTYFNLIICLNVFSLQPLRPSLNLIDYFR
jgi:hypothetical protein